MFGDSSEELVENYKLGHNADIVTATTVTDVWFIVHVIHPGAAGAR